MCILQLQNVYRRRVEVFRPRLNLSANLLFDLQILYLLYLRPMLGSQMYTKQMTRLFCLR